MSEDIPPVLQVIFSDHMFPDLQAWLATYGRQAVHLPLPGVVDGVDDIPTYVIQPIQPSRL
jgi:hypothetical protein